jgi:hypothetical protein
MSSLKAERRFKSLRCTDLLKTQILGDLFWKPVAESISEREV